MEEGVPYAVAFIDIIMPPGIDGVDTIIKIWELDPNIQIVIITAYSLYNWNEIVKRIGVSDQLYFLKKPFDAIEIINLATVLAKRWALSKSIKLLLKQIETIVSSSEAASEFNTQKTVEKIYQAVEALKKLGFQLENNSIKKRIT